MDRDTLEMFKEHLKIIDGINDNLNKLKERVDIIKDILWEHFKEEEEDG